MFLRRKVKMFHCTHSADCDPLCQAAMLCHSYMDNGPTISCCFGGFTKDKLPEESYEILKVCRPSPDATKESKIESWDLLWSLMEEDPDQ